MNVPVHYGSSIQTPTGPTSELQNAVNVQIVEPEDERLSDQIDDLRAIYGDPTRQLSEMLSALNLAIAACREATEFEKSNNSYRADEKMLLVQAELGNLFFLRDSFEDGFGLVIGALIFSFVNKEGQPFTYGELFAILRTLNELQSAPYCSIEKAVDITDKLEIAGLSPTPKPLSDLLVEAEEAGIVEL
jgi:hypothetical protein